MCNLPGKNLPMQNNGFTSHQQIKLLASIIWMILNWWTLQEEYKFKDSVGKLKCGHDYHADCIKKWLQVKNVCPICKASVADDSEGME